MKKIFLIFFLSLTVSFIGFMPAKAISVSDIQAQLAIILAKIVEIQAQLDILKAQEAQSGNTIVTAEKSLSVSAPASGEVFSVGKNSNITWNSSGFSSSAIAQIKLSDGREATDSYYRELTIVSAMPNSGSYTWEIPDLLSGREIFGSLYKIVVYITDGNETKSAASSYFSISKPMNPYVKIVSPNGGETWQAGKTYTILWDTLGLSDGKIDIDVINPNGVALYDRQAAFNIVNTGQFDWKIPADLFGNYKIKISAFDKSRNPQSDSTSASYFNIYHAGVTKNSEANLASISEALTRITRQISTIFAK